jgi:hypothetical protein
MGSHPKSLALGLIKHRMLLAVFARLKAMSWRVK